MSSSFDRRRFWQQLAGLTASAANEMTPEFFLEDLARLPLPEILPLVPKLVEGVRIEVDGWRLLARREDAKPIELGAWLPAEAWLLNHFDGTRTLEVLASELSTQAGWPPTTAREFTRTFFVRLATLNVVVPANCPLAPR